MQVGDVIAAARDWVAEHGSRMPGFRGAYLAGSINELALDEPFPAFRDVDVYVVLDDPARIASPHETLVYRDLLLEASCVSLEEHRSAAAVLASLNAANVARCAILSDPDGALLALREAVARDYARPEWIAARCEAHKNVLLMGLGGAAAAEDPLFHLGMIVLYGTGLVALARGRGPTVRRCLSRAGALLRSEAQSALHDELLAVMGSARMRREEVIRSLQDCIEAFDRAADAVPAPFFGSWKLRAHARPYLVDGAWEMIDAGEHREAMFWIAVMHSLADKAVPSDGIGRLREALGIATAAQWKARVALAQRVAEQLFAFSGSAAASRAGAAPPLS